ncbi:MAG: prenyltransferase/squalene oxidase repeat-containing protein, partial [Pirellula sp.]
MSKLISSERLRGAILNVVADLERLKGSQDHWTGALSTSALSTATAVSAMSICRNQFRSDAMPERQPSHDPKYSPTAWDSLIERGSAWLAAAQNSDGGFGDTDRSLSNIATTYLVLAAWKLAGHCERYATQEQLARQYVERMGSWDGLRKRYGKDKTFVVPIMTNCALAGLVDWKEIPALPFEAAALPQSWYRLVQLPVVSYAIPALVAMGQAHFHHRAPWNPIVRWIRTVSIQPTRRVLTRMQPTSGGYLEAVPLTSFVLMSLASIGQTNSRVSVEARKFIIDSVLPDGSWPIDTNLATWVTSLASVPYFATSVDLLSPTRGL